MEQDYVSRQDPYFNGERQLLGAKQCLLYSLRKVVINVTAVMERMCQSRVRARAQPSRGGRTGRTASSMLYERFGGSMISATAPNCVQATLYLML